MSQAGMDKQTDTPHTPIETLEMAAQPASNVRPRRPLVVTVLVILFALNSVLMLALAALYVAQTGLFSQQVAAEALAQTGDAPGLFVVARAIGAAALAVLYPITTVGLYRLQPWAWRSGMIILGIQLAVGLAEYLIESPVVPGLFISVAAVFLLNQHSVRKAFGIAKESRDNIAQPIERAGDPV
jgi:hypothetical protein